MQDHRGNRIAIRHAQQSVALETDETIKQCAYTLGQLRAIARARALDEPEVFRNAFIEAFVQTWLARETALLR